MATSPDTKQARHPPALALWARRHPKRMLALALTVALALFVGVFGAIVYAAFASMQHSTPYRKAIERARAHPVLVEALGQPIEPDWLMSGEINESDARGSASFLITLHGPKAQAELDVKAGKNEGAWEFQTLSAKVEGRAEPIDLLEHAAPAPEPAR